METLIKVLHHRAERVNFELNHADKYLEQFKTEEYYTKIGNRLDDILRVSYFLVKFFISQPPKYQPPNNLNQKGEELLDYGVEKVDVPGPIEYIEENYTLYTLQDLPPEVESEFDYNYFAFYSFLAYLKPSFYFIHDCELIPSGRSETQKEKVTRVLLNLAQLLAFTRSFDASGSKDVMNVLRSLFYDFDNLFSIKDDDSGHDSYAFHQEYPNQAALFAIHGLLYDDMTLEEIEQYFHLLLDTHTQVPELDDFNTTLQTYKFAIENLFQSSANAKEFKEQLSKQFTIENFKESLLKLSKTLANKVIREAIKLQTVDLNKTVLTVNYDNEIKKREEAMKKMEVVVKDAANVQHQEMRKQLLEELESREREIEILRQEHSIKDDTIQNLSQQLDKEISNKSSSFRSFTNIKEFQTTYPQIYKEISLRNYKAASHKYGQQLDVMDTDLIAAKQEIKKAKKRTAELEKQLQELQKNHGHDDDEVMETSQWEFQQQQQQNHHHHPSQPGGVRRVESNGSIDDRPDYGSINGYQPRPYDDRGRGNFYIPQPQPQPQPHPGYNGGPGPGYRSMHRYRENY